jgi:Na+/H+-translocating membrane pyrophosphatase
MSNLILPTASLKITSRSPAVIADSAGDYAGSAVGMGSNLFESDIGSIIFAMP